MKPEEIKLGDWTRFFLGEVPPVFYLELVIRAALIYLLLIFSMRLLGKRMSTQVSRLELCALVSLASAVGVPMLSADRGILPAFIITAVVVGLSKLIARVSARNQKIEEITQGDLDLLVQDGVMNFGIMERVRITRERLFAQLRSENINQLGLVKRLYMEANGTFTLIEEEKPKPGLMVLPGWDQEFIDRKIATTNISICNNCGANKPNHFENSKELCLNCGRNGWTKAVEVQL